LVIVNTKLLDEVLGENILLRRAYNLLENDIEVQSLWYMANVMAVNRLKYNDHGPVHAKIAAGAAVYIYKLLRQNGVESTLIKDGVVDREEYAMLVPLIGGLLHDIGNSVHRDLHEKIGAILAKPIIERVLEKIVEDPYTRFKLRQGNNCIQYTVQATM